MACYGNCTKELVLYKYKETGIFSGDVFLDNDLTGSIFPGVQFYDVTIEKSYLDRSVLSDMVCDHVMIEQSDCNSVQAVNSRIQNSSFTRCNSIKADFSNAAIHKTRFEGCIAHSIRFTGGRITESVFYECQMYKARFDKSILIKVAFKPGKKADCATLQKADFTNSMLIECSFMDIDLIGSRFDNSVFIGCDFTGTKMDDIDLSKSSLINCIVDGQPKAPGKLTNLRQGSTIL